jgi:hypothetical protein
MYSKVFSARKRGCKWRPIIVVYMIGFKITLPVLVASEYCKGACIRGFQI